MKNMPTKTTSETRVLFLKLRNGIAALGPLKPDAKITNLASARKVVAELHPQLAKAIVAAKLGVEVTTTVRTIKPLRQ